MTDKSKALRAEYRLLGASLARALNTHESRSEKVMRLNAQAQRRHQEKVLLPMLLRRQELHRIYPHRGTPISVERYFLTSTLTNAKSGLS